MNIADKFQEQIDHYDSVLNDKTMSISERRKAKIRMEEMRIAQEIVSELNIAELQAKAEKWDEFVNQATNKSHKPKQSEF